MGNIEKPSILKYQKQREKATEKFKEEKNMDVVITINEKDLLKNPDILDVLKGLAKGLKEPEAAAVIAEAVHTEPVEEQKAPEETTEPVAEEAVTEQEVSTEQAAEENKEEPAEYPAEEQTVTLEELRAIIAKVSKKHGVEKAKGILHKFGVTNLSALDAKHYAAAMKEAEGAL